MKIIKEKISMEELKEMASHMNGSLVKAIVDVQKGIVAVDAPLHSDLFEFIMQGEHSEPKNLWGINLYPEKMGTDFIEFDSMMNIRPTLGNKTRGVESEELRNKITSVVNNLIK